MGEVSLPKGYLILESGECYPGVWRGGKGKAGEVVFNTSHFGYEEMATDPSYYSQILVLTAPMQGNYGANKDFWESRDLWINGFVCLEIQNSERDSTWLKRLNESQIPVLTDIDSRSLVLRLRSMGTTWGACVEAESPEKAVVLAKDLIEKIKSEEQDWVFRVSREYTQTLKGKKAQGPKVALIDYGCKENIIRELLLGCSELGVFPSRTSAAEIKKWSPNAIFLTNGPGNPEAVKESVEVVRELLGWRPIFGICMGHQILSKALGAKTFKLKFGHRGGNHPVKDLRTGEIFVTSQNHGYAVDSECLPEGVRATHINLNDGTNEGIECQDKKCRSVQFHPESCPGPREARVIFDDFFKWVQ